MAVQLGSAYGQIILDASGVDAGARQAQGILGGLESSMSGIGKSLTKNVTLPLVGVGAIATKVAGDFESQMATLSIAARSSGTALEDLRAVALRTGADTQLIGISASQSAEAIENLYKAGLTTADIFGDLNGYLEGTTELSGALRAAVDLQAASELNLSQASELVAISMATFGLSAEDATGIVDNFVQSADASVTSVDELAAAMVNVGPTAAAFGWTLEDTNTALAILSERGIRGAEAGTALKSMMTNMMRPTDDVVETLKELNITLYDSEGRMRSLPDIMSQLSAGMAGLSEEERNLAVQTLAGTYGMKAMNTLLAEGTEGWQEMEGAIASAATAQDVAAARADTFKGSMEALMGSLETLLIQVGTPLINDFLRPAVGVLTQVVGWFTELPEPVQKSAVAFGLLLAGIGPVMKMGGGLVGMFKDLVGAGKMVVGGVQALAGAIPGLVGTLGPLAVAAIAVGAAYMKWQDTQEMVAEGTRQVGNAWGDFFDQQVAGGASAAEVLEAYRAKQLAVKEALDEGGAVADIFIRNQKELMEDVDGLQMALAKTATGWEEFASLMAAAGLEVSLTREQFEALRNETTALDQAAGAVQGAFAGVVEGALGVASAVGEMELGETGRTLREVAAAGMDMKSILDTLEAAFQATGMEGGSLSDAMEEMGVELGGTSRAQARLTSDVRFLTAAFAEGSLSTAAFSGYMEQAQAGTLNLTAAQARGIGAAMEHAKAQREAAAAADEYRLSLLSQSEALKGVEAQQAAQIALRQLEEEFSAGMLSLDAYEAAVISVQDAYGLATPQSRALAMGIEELNGLLVAGRIAPDDYAAAVEAMRSAAEGGEDSVEGLMGAVEDAVGPIEEGTGAVGGLGSEADAAADKMDRMAEAARRAKGDLEAMTATDWIVNVGTAGTLPPGVTAVRLQTGAWEIPALTLAVLHPGEMVLPAEVAETLRGMTATPAPVYPAPSVAGGVASTTYVTVEGDHYETAVYDRASAALLAAMMAERKRDRLNAFMGG